VCFSLISVTVFIAGSDSVSQRQGEASSRAESIALSVGTRFSELSQCTLWAKTHDGTVCHVCMRCSLCSPTERTETPDVLVEVSLDGGLIFSSKTKKEEEDNLVGCNSATSTGKHHLAVSESGYAKWEKEVVLVGGAGHFWEKLQKQ
jgi:hypothetical protein